MQSGTGGLTFQLALPDVDLVSRRSWLPLPCQESTNAPNPYRFSMVLDRLQVILPEFFRPGRSQAFPGIRILCLQVEDFRDGTGSTWRRAASVFV
jgi:hypothetical protein